MHFAVLVAAFEQIAVVAPDLLPEHLAGLVLAELHVHVSWHRWCGAEVVRVASADRTGIRTNADEWQDVSQIFQVIEVDGWCVVHDELWVDYNGAVQHLCIGCGFGRRRLIAGGELLEDDEAKVQHFLVGAGVGRIGPGKALKAGIGVCLSFGGGSRLGEICRCAGWSSGRSCTCGLEAKCRSRRLVEG